MKEVSIFKISGRNAEIVPICKRSDREYRQDCKRCNVEIVFGEQKVPEYDVPEGYTAVTYLNHLCEEGLNVVIRILQKN